MRQFFTIFLFSVLIVCGGVFYAMLDMNHIIFTLEIILHPRQWTYFFLEMPIFIRVLNKGNFTLKS